MKPQALFVAQPTYAAEIEHRKNWSDLPIAASEAGKLASELAARGYVLGLQDLLKGGEKADIEKNLDEWSARVPNGSCLVFLWTGHGCSDGGRHYLVCRNSPKEGISSFNAIDTGAIGTVIANSKAEKILIVLDTCYSGLGADEIAEGLGRILATRRQVVGQQRAFAIIASAHPLEEAKEGILLRALRTALLESNVSPNARRWTDHDKFINSGYLSKASRLLMTDDVSAPQYVARGDEQDFIPNPRFRANLPAENVEERQWRLSQSGAAEHFELAARGIEVGEQGWFFSGRKRLLRALVDWLNIADRGVRIVTGPPGAGKSAVVGRLVTLSDQEYRQEAIKVRAVDEGNDPVPPIGVFDAAVHAKGKTLDDCARALAKGLRIPVGQEASIDVDRLVADIGKLRRTITLAIDALDEAAGAQSEAIASRLIVPLGRLPKVKVLVGSRRSLDGAVIPEAEDRHGRLRAAFAPDAILDDLEDEIDTHDDIADYVRRRLASSDKHRNDDPATIEQAAQRVAEKANGVFLYARIVSRTLQELDRLDGSLPEGALDAFEQDIKDRFKGGEQRVNDLFGALAWGEGKGLTRRVWPLIANALSASQLTYNDDDVAWVLSHAGWHVIEAGEDGQTVYRLAHQALGDYYRAKLNEQGAEERIVAELTRGIAGADWLNCDPYSWRHLADHAAKGNRLGDLIQDSGYLSVADPARLVVALSSIKNAEGRRFADIYDRVVDRLVDVSPIERMAYIHMTAQMEDPKLAPVLEPAVPTQWLCRWARARPSAPHRIIGKHNRSVSSIVFGAIDGTPVIVSGSEDMTVRLWNARTGTPTGEPLYGHTGDITSVAFCEIHGTPVIVSGSVDKTIRLWNGRTGAPIGEPLYGHTGHITSVAFGEIHGALVIASGSYDRTIRLWNASSGTPIGEPLKGHAKGVTSVAFGEIDGGLVIVSGSADGTIRLWSARTGALKDNVVGHPQGVTSVAFYANGGAPVIVSGGDKTVCVWYAYPTVPIGNALVGHTEGVTSVASGEIDGAPLVVSGGLDKTVRLWGRFPTRPIGTPLEGHTQAVTSVALGEIDGAPFIASGGLDGTIRLWNAHTRGPIGALLEGHNERVFSVASGKIEGAPVIVSGSDDRTVRLWDACTGAPIRKPLEGRASRVTSVALGEVDGAPVIASGRDDKTIRLWNARTGAPIGVPKPKPPGDPVPIGKPLAGHTGEVSSLAFAEIDGAPIIVSGSVDKTIRLWNAPRTIRPWISLTAVRIGMLLDGLSLGKITSLAFREFDGAPIGKALDGHAGAVTSLAIGEIDGDPIIVSGSVDKTIRLWNARTGAPIGEPLEGHTYVVSSVAFGEIDGAPVIVSGSVDKTIRLWNARTGMLIAKPLEGHADGVCSVTVGEIDGGPVIVSGSADGTIRVWDARMRRERPFTVCAVGDEVTSIALVDHRRLVAGLTRGIALFELQPVSEV